LAFFQRQFGAEHVQELKKITFCGNDGDPIYCRDLVDICVWFKTLNPTVAITIITNGSYKPPDWWQYLGHVLGEHDEVHWSLDGWDQDSNQQYRVNSDWDSIIAGITAFASVNTSTYRVWDSIAFRFNEYHLGQQQSLAQQLGFDLYQLTRSTKFGSKYPEQYGSIDLLEPTQPGLVPDGHRFERNHVRLTRRSRPGQDIKTLFWQRAQQLESNTPYSGICLIGNKGVFLNSRGQIYPCCWTANRYDHNQVWHDRASRFDLWQRNLTDIKNDEFWSTEFLEFDSHECRSKCTRAKLKDQEHTTEW
jgi:hypothetical protein